MNRQCAKAGCGAGNSRLLQAANWRAALSMVYGAIRSSPLKETAMQIDFDLDRQTCTLELNGQPRTLALDSLLISTNREARCSVLIVDDQALAISDAQAEQLVAAGVADERFKLFEDDD
jgi:hypothetical protein